ncbi:protein tyrosine phosphatase [[Pantoea] beijingensis]|uniref:protein-tyrosine-phosphatase n=1 Tax=[Pantoea] beijingensis TaxID=1324864 RepID=A0A443IAS1_9GAMM|nr:protein tyrosine phosphatase [[Pantoea] beijingensis]RWR01184.1 protein tyrosine phosphatase [[Pantoea] beijingensis]
MFNSILVVCVGNICRSPTGERLLRKYLPAKKVDSAGIGALVGREADASAKHIADKNLLSLNGHCARQLTKAICHEYDLILVMEKKHITAVCDYSPEIRGKVMLFGHWTGREIPDPYKKSLDSFQAVYGLLDAAAQQWANKLS